MKLNENNFPNKYDSWERGTISARVQQKRLNTEGAFCPDCHIVMVPSGGCFHCPSCGGANAKCGG